MGTADPGIALRQKAFAPYLSRSPVLIARFVEYCQDDSVVLQAPALVALSRLRPGSSLLLDCCKRVLAQTSREAGDRVRRMLACGPSLACWRDLVGAGRGKCCRPTYPVLAAKLAQLVLGLGW